MEEPVEDKQYQTTQDADFTTRFIDAEGSKLEQTMFGLKYQIRFGRIMLQLQHR